MKKLTRKRLKIAAAVIGGLFLLCVIIALIPGFQRWVVFGQLQKIDPQAQLERIHVTPFSADIQGLQLTTKAWAVSLESLKADLSPWALPLKHLVVKSAKVSGLAVKVTPAEEELIEETEEQETPFPGLLALTETGFKISLDDVEAEATFSMPRLEAKAVLSGGGLAPEGTGNFEIENLTLNVPDQEELRRVTVTGPVTLTENEDGSIDSLTWDLRIAAEGKLFEDEAVLLVEGAISDEGVASTETEGKRVHPPEHVHLTVREPGREASESALFGLQADYSQASQTFQAGFNLAADNTTLQPFTLALDLPDFQGVGNGEFSWSLEAMTGASSMEVDVVLTELDRLSNILASIGKLEIKEKHSLSLSPEELVLENFTMTLRQDNQENVLDFTINNPLSFQLLDSGSPLQGLEGIWLTLGVGVPLDWFDPILGNYELEGDDLAGELTFAGNPLEQLTIESTKPLSVSTATLSEDSVPLLDKVSVQVNPKATISPQNIVASLGELLIQARGQDLLIAQAKANLDLTDARGFKADIDGDMELFARGLISKEEAVVPQGETATRIMAARRRAAAVTDAIGQASLKMMVKASAIPDQVRAEKASMRLKRLENDAVLADIELASPITATFAEESVSFKGLEGPWMHALFDGVPVSIPAVFVDGIELQGGLIHGAFDMGANGTEGGFQINFSEPLTIEQLSVTKDEQILLSEANIAVLPSVDYQPGQAEVTVQNFKASSKGRLLSSGNFKAKAKLKQLKPTEVDFTLDGRAGIPGLMNQPMLKPYLLKPFKQLIHATLKTEGVTDLKSLNLSQMEAGLVLKGGGEIVTAASKGPIEVKHFEIQDLETALKVVSGKGSLTIQEFPLWLPLSFVEAEPWELESGSLKGAFDWSITEGKARLEASDAFQLNSLSVQQGEKPMLNNVSMSTRPDLSLTHQTATLTADSLELRADGAEPLKGRFDTTVAFAEALPVQDLSTRLSGPITPWFKQPLMPPNAVSAGTLDASAKLVPSGAFTLDADLNQAGFRNKAPYLQLAEMTGSGQINMDKGNINGTFPATLRTSDGTSDALTEVSLNDVRGDSALTVKINGQTLRLADLQTLAADFFPAQTTVPEKKNKDGIDNLSEAGSREKIQPYNQENLEHSVHQKQELEKLAKFEDDIEDDLGDGEEEQAPEAIDFATLSKEAVKPKATDPDEVPFWKGLPRSSASFRFDEVLYTGYVKFSEVAGDATVTKDRLSLDNFEAKFHQSTIGSRATIDWDESAMPKPYSLTANSEVKDFNLSAFFSELVPGEKPRVEGLFKMDAQAAGSFPNLEQVRNFLTFGLNMESRKGLFRAIPPNSQLAMSGSDTAAFFGEILSYVPTGALGMGTLSRLVAYMREVPYEIVALNMKRGTDLNVRIDRMEVRSDQMLIYGKGGILYQQEEDVFEQPLDLTASMDARGEFAAILSGLGLLTDRSAGNNYWRGFDFRIWGSMAKPKTNFDNIVTQASTGTLTRNITNPFHGIWSNIKYSGEGPLDHEEIDKSREAELSQGVEQ